jgi:hypothetical protein
MGAMRGIAMMLAALLVAGCSGEADFSGAIDTQILPAEEYQQEIAAIDRLLFREQPLGDAGVQALETTITGLAKRVGSLSPDSRFLKLESLELRLLAEHAGQLPPDGTGKALQNDWMRIRNNVFDDRAWFVRSAADLEYAASVVPPPGHKVTAPPPAETAPPPRAIEHRAALDGTWRVDAMTGNGKPQDDPELSGSTWTFDAPRLIMRAAEGTEHAANFIVEEPYLRVTMPSGEEGWMRYELDSAGLRVAFYDGLGAKPPSFEAPPDSNPILVVVRLTAVEPR